MKPVLIAAAALATVVTTTGLAQAAERHYRPTYSSFATETPFIDRRQAEQRRLIQQGRRNGSLTWFEYRRLLREQDRIAAMERRAKSDGFADRRERQAIRSALASAARTIDRLTHNGWKSWSRQPYRSL